MPIYQYEAMNSVGQAVKGRIEAASADEARQKIRATGNFPTAVMERTAKKGRKKATSKPRTSAGKSRKTAGRVSVKDLSVFTRQLATLQEAGLPLLRSLKILEEQQKPGPLRNAIKYVTDDVEAGASLSEAMQRHPKAFDSLYTNMIRAGELGGVLDIILKRLAEFMEKSARLKRKIVGAMIYPAAVITFALLIVTGLLLFVVPSFAKIFESQGSKLPAMTQSLIDMSNWVAAGGWFFLIGVPVLLVFGLKFLRQNEQGAYYYDKVFLKLPIFGMLSGKSSVARFSRTLATLLHAGVPILDSLAITADTAGNQVYTRALRKVRDSIREGEPIAKPLKQAQIVDSMVTNMIDVGEETGELDRMLERIANNYDEEVEVVVSSLVSMLEPVMVIVLGGIVGYIVVALFLPMIGMLEAMK